MKKTLKRGAAPKAKKSSGELDEREVAFRDSLKKAALQSDIIAAETGYKPHISGSYEKFVENSKRLIALKRNIYRDALKNEHLFSEKELGQYEWAYYRAKLNLVYQQYDHFRTYEMHERRSEVKLAKLATALTDLLNEMPDVLDKEEQERIKKLFSPA